jgi:hypothetical protein
VLEPPNDNHSTRWILKHPDTISLPCPFIHCR